ncbi:hypothetical protein LCGC14_0691790 [marine sediment metagenome]|uniref:Uncharacterized protein n=1 Tax=marine sediment metagenome TaxID=412755 RepID=A0A0F9QKB7_9ZZZZ
MTLYRNRGARFPRDDEQGHWETDAVHEPTEHELRTRAHKLVAVSALDPEYVESVSATLAEEVIDPSTGLAEWPIQMRPEMYVRLHPEGKHADLARAHVAQAEEDADPDAEDI